MPQAIPQGQATNSLQSKRQLATPKKYMRKDPTSNMRDAWGTITSRMSEEESRPKHDLGDQARCSKRETLAMLSTTKPPVEEAPHLRDHEHVQLEKLAIHKMPAAAPRSPRPRT